MSLTSSTPTPTATTLRSRSRKTHLSPDAVVFPITESSSSKDTWRLAALVVRGLQPRHSVTDFPTVAFYSVHIQNKVASEREAATSLLRRFHAHMSAFSTVGDMSSVAPGNALLWGTGGLDDSRKDRTGFLSCPSARTRGGSRHTAATRLTKPTLFPCLSRHQRPDSIMRSSPAHQRRLERVFASGCLHSNPPRTDHAAPVQCRTENTHQLNHSIQPVPSKRENLMPHLPHSAPLALCLSAWRRLLLYAHTRALSLAAHDTFDYTFGSRD